MGCPCMSLFLCHLSGHTAIRLVGGPMFIPLPGFCSSGDVLFSHIFPIIPYGLIPELGE